MPHYNNLCSCNECMQYYHNSCTICLNNDIKNQIIKKINENNPEPDLLKNLKKNKNQHYIDTNEGIVVHSTNKNSNIDDYVQIKILKDPDSKVSVLSNVENNNPAIISVLCMPSGYGLVKWSNLDTLNTNNIEYELNLEVNKSIYNLEKKLLTFSQTNIPEPAPVYPYDIISTQIDITSIITTWTDLCDSTNTTITSTDLSPQTVNGNTLKLINITDNTSVLPKPKILITSLHHGREPVSLTNALFSIESMLKLNKDGNLNLDYPLPEEEAVLTPILLRSEISGANNDILNIYITQPNPNTPISGFQFNVNNVELVTPDAFDSPPAPKGIAYDTFHTGGLIVNSAHTALGISTTGQFLYSDDGLEELFCRLQCTATIEDDTVICLTDIIIASPIGTAYEVDFTNGNCDEETRENDKIYFEEIDKINKTIIVKVETTDSVGGFTFNLTGVTGVEIEQTSPYYNILVSMDNNIATFTAIPNASGNYMSGEATLPTISYNTIGEIACIENVLFINTAGETIDMEIGECLNYTELSEELQEQLTNFDLNTMRYILRTRDIYFIPLVNPDGYYYNYELNSSGGGYWRKNRNSAFLCNGNTAGVDLNRNYPENFCDPSGSSIDPCSDQFCGSTDGTGSGFTEIETQIIESVFNQHTFNLCLNHHAFGNLLIHPDNTQNQEELDNYIAIGNKLVESNNFELGTPIETVNYNVAGAAIQWMRQHCMAFTPETGNYNDGFWPSNVQVFELNVNNLDMHKKAFLLAGQYYEASNLLFDGGNIVDKNKTQEITLDITNCGLFPKVNEADANSVCTISLILPGNHIITLTTQQSILSLETIHITENVNIPNFDGESGEENEIIVRVKDNYDNQYYFTQNFNMITGILGGDVNQDNTLNVADIVNIVNHITGESTLTDEQIEIADVNNDGELNILDIVAISNSIINP